MPNCTLQERAAAADSGHTLGPAALFFGCRKAAHDYIYADELRGFKDAGVVTHLSCAFSRDGHQKVYVQDHLREHSGESPHPVDIPPMHKLAVLTPPIRSGNARLGAACVVTYVEKHSH